MGYIAPHHENLEVTLDEKQKDILKRFDDCWSELSEINEREIITYAFRLGARIVLEVLNGISIRDIIKNKLSLGDGICYRLFFAYFVKHTLKSRGYTLNTPLIHPKSTLLTL